METKSVKIVPQNDAEGTKKIPLKKICVKIYLSEQEFLDWVGMAEECGKRQRGLKPFRKKPHGFQNERVANTKGLVKFVKDKIIPYWKAGKKERKERIERIKKEAKEFGMKIQE